MFSSTIKEQFQQLAPECITAQATSVEVSGSLPAGLDGPASTGSPEIAVGEPIVEEDSVPIGHDDVPSACHTAPLDFNNTDDVEMPHLQFSASDIGSADLDVEQVTRQFAERLTRHWNNINGKGTGDHPMNIISGEIDKEIIELKQLAGHLSSVEFQSKVGACIQDLEVAEGTILELCQSDKGYILKIGLTPLSMYDKDLWAMSFPQLFPYGDGVFGIAR